MPLLRLLAAAAFSLAATAQAVEPLPQVGLRPLDNAWPGAAQQPPANLPPPAGMQSPTGVQPPTGIRDARSIPASAPGAPALEPPAEARLPGNLAIDDRPEPLTLGEVLDSVRRHYPLLQAIERERGVTAGRLTAAMGAFDTNIDMSGNSLAPGTYENYRSDFGLSQLLQSGGIQVFGGYRTGLGDFPTYYLNQKTANAGEVRGGITMPLARDRDIDSARAGRDRARIDLAIAEPTIVRSRLDYMRAAALAYWTWLGSGEREGAAERLEQLAVRRDGEIAARVTRGVMANIERIDNQKNIALRRGLLVQADRQVQQSTIDVSLFLRDEMGKPLLPARRRMQPMPEPVPPSVSFYEESLARALMARPEFQRLSLEREKLVVERRLAVNDTLPGIDAQLVGNQDAGFGKSPLSGIDGLDRQVLQASLVFQMPAQRRNARGRMQTVDSQIMQLDRRLDFAFDSVRAEVQDAYSKLERAYEFHKQAIQQEELAALVAEAEREQFRLGRSDILRVTLREQAKFDADLLEIAARQEYWRADADLRAADTSLDMVGTGLAQGRLLAPVPEPMPLPEVIPAPPARPAPPAAAEK